MDTEQVLRQLLEVQTAMLAEVRLLRQALETGLPARAVAAPAASAAVLTDATDLPAEPAAAPAETPQAAAPDIPAEPEPIPPAETPPPPPRRRGMMTMDELADLGGEFLGAGSRPKDRSKSMDLADLGGSLIDEIKAKNRTKRDAFAEFDRLRRDR